MRYRTGLALCLAVTAMLPLAAHAQLPNRDGVILHDTPNFRGQGTWARFNYAEAVGGSFYVGISTTQQFEASAFWSGTLPANGVTYDVQVFVPRPAALEALPRTSHALYQLDASASGTAAREINQQVATSTWFSLGTIRGPGHYEIRVSDNTGEPINSRFIVADAVHLVPVLNPPPGVPLPILNTAPELKPSGWLHVFSAEAIGGSFASIFNGANIGEAVATWSGALLQGPGLYEVEVFIPREARQVAPPRTASAVYSVFMGSDPFPVIISHAVPVSGWISLGRFAFLNTNRYEIRMDNATGETPGTHVVVANAVRLTARALP